MSKTANNGKDIPWVSDGVSTAKSDGGFCRCGQRICLGHDSPKPNTINSKDLAESLNVPAASTKVFVAGVLPA